MGCRVSRVVINSARALRTFEIDFLENGASDDKILLHVFYLIFHGESYPTL